MAVLVWDVDQSPPGALGMEPGCHCARLGLPDPVQTAQRCGRSVATSYSLLHHLW